MRDFQLKLVSNPRDPKVSSPDFTIQLSYPEPGIARLHYDRVKRGNALSPEAYQALREAFEELAEDKRSQVILFTTEGDHFGGGADLRFLLTLKNPEAARAFSTFINRVALRIQEVAFRKPILTVIPKRIQGGMSHLAMATNRLVVGDESEVLREPGFFHFKILAGGGGITRLVRHLADYEFVSKDEKERIRFAMQEAFRILVLDSGKFMSGQEVVQKGLAMAAVSLNGLMDHALLLAREMKMRPQDFTVMHRAKMQYPYDRVIVEAVESDLLKQIGSHPSLSLDLERSVAVSIVTLMAKALIEPLGEETIQTESALFAPLFFQADAPSRIRTFLDEIKRTKQK